MEDVERLGTGVGVAVLCNSRAKRVTPMAVRSLARALPDAEVLVSEDKRQARRLLEALRSRSPRIVFSAGGDGAMVQLLNVLRETWPRPFPVIGILPLGTGNGWARAVGAPPSSRLERELPLVPWPPPTEWYDLLRIDDTVCHMAGVGWDAHILNDYVANLDRRSRQLFLSPWTAKLHRGLTGYVYSALRFTVPDELALARAGQRTRVHLESLGPRTLHVVDGGTEEVPAGSLFDGPMAIASFATTPEYGFGFRAFPHARDVRQHVNIRVYDRGALEAIRRLPALWRGRPVPGMHDFLVVRARLTFSRPAPLHIGGDPAGFREALEVVLADEAVEILDWRAVRAARRRKVEGPPSAPLELPTAASPP